MIRSSIIRGAFARSFGTVVRSMRPVASMAVVNSHSPAAELLSIENPVAPNSAAPLPSPGSGRGRTVERGGPSHALRFVPALTSYEGPRAGFCNFGRPKSSPAECFCFFARSSSTRKSRDAAASMLSVSRQSLSLLLLMKAT